MSKKQVDHPQYIERIRSLKRQLRISNRKIVQLLNQNQDRDQQFGIIFENSSMVKLLIDPSTGNIMDANKAACHFYGYDRQFLIQSNIQKISQSPINLIVERLQLAVTNHQFFESRHQLASGELRQVEVFSSPIDLRDHLMLHTVIRDVTARREEDAELRMLWHAINQSGNSIIITDPHGSIEYVNPYFTELTGYSLQEVIGEKPSILKSGETSQSDYEMLWKTIKTGSKWTGEFHNRKKSGELYWERASISPVTDMDGVIQHFVAIKENITEEKLMWGALQTKEQTLRRSQEVAHVGDWMWDIASNSVRWSEEMHRIFGIDPATFTGDLNAIITKAIHPEDREAVFAANRAVIEQNLPQSMEYRIVLEDGTIRTVWAQPADQVLDEKGTVISLSGIVQDITERKRIEDLLQQSEIRFRTLVESMNDVIYTLDENGHHNGLYGQWTHAPGFTPDRYLGKTASEILGSRDGEIHEQANQMALAGTASVYEWRTEDSYFQTHVSPLRNGQGKITGVVGIGRDIRQLKQIEQGLREAERFAHAAIDALSAHIAILDEQGVILLVNTAWRNYALENGGTIERACEGMNYFDVIRQARESQPDDQTAQSVETAINRILSGQEQEYSVEYPCHSPEDQRWFEARITRFAGDGPIRIVIAHKDITERVLALLTLDSQNRHLATIVDERTAQLKRLNRRMMAILNNVNNPILLVQENGAIDLSNPAFNRELGYSPDDLYGHRIWEIFEPPFHRVAEEYFRNVTDTRSFSARIATKQGLVRDFEISFSLVSDNHNHVVCTLYDISHLKEVERLKDQFISMVSHELRTPVSTIMLSAETLFDYYQRLTSEQRIKKVKQIHQQATRLKELINAILDTSRIESRRGERSTATVDVTQALQEVIGELSDHLSAKNHHLQVHIDPKPQLIKGEYLDMIRIWRNLLSNANKYTDTGGKISVRLFSSQSSDVLNSLDFAGELPNFTAQPYIIGVVADTGYGIDPEDMEMLFTRFFRGWAAGSNISGTGLGLSLVRELLRFYGGDIAVASTRGVGTTFCFWLATGIS